jgi:hypothetical protein
MGPGPSKTSGVRVADFIAVRYAANDYIRQRPCLQLARGYQAAMSCAPCADVPPETRAGAPAATNLTVVLRAETWTSFAPMSLIEKLELTATPGGVAGNGGSFSWDVQSFRAAKGVGADLTFATVSGVPGDPTTLVLRGTSGDVLLELAVHFGALKLVYQTNRPSGNQPAAAAAAAAAALSGAFYAATLEDNGDGRYTVTIGDDRGPSTGTPGTDAYEPPKTPQCACAPALAAGSAFGPMQSLYNGVDKDTDGAYQACDANTVRHNYAYAFPPSSGGIDGSNCPWIGMQVQSDMSASGKSFEATLEVGWRDYTASPWPMALEFVAPLFAFVESGVGEPIVCTVWRDHVCRRFVYLDVLAPRAGNAVCALYRHATLAAMLHCVSAKATNDPLCDTKCDTPDARSRYCDGGGLCRWSGTTARVTTVQADGESPAAAVGAFAALSAAVGPCADDARTVRDAAVYAAVQRTYASTRLLGLGPNDLGRRVLGEPIVGVGDAGEPTPCVLVCYRADGGTAAAQLAHCDVGGTLAGAFAPWVYCDDGAGGASFVCWADVDARRARVPARVWIECTASEGTEGVANPWLDAQTPFRAMPVNLMLDNGPIVLAGVEDLYVDTVARDAVNRRGSDPQEKVRSGQPIRLSAGRPSGGDTFVRVSLDAGGKPQTTALVSRDCLHIDECEWALFTVGAFADAEPARHGTSVAAPRAAAETDDTGSVALDAFTDVGHVKPAFRGCGNLGGVVYATLTTSAPFKWASARGYAQMQRDGLAQPAYEEKMEQLQEDVRSLVTLGLMGAGSDAVESGDSEAEAEKTESAAEVAEYKSKWVQCKKWEALCATYVRALIDGGAGPAVVREALRRLAYSLSVDATQATLLGLSGLGAVGAEWGAEWDLSKDIYAKSRGCDVDPPAARQGGTDPTGTPTGTPTGDAGTGTPTGTPTGDAGAGGADAAKPTGGDFAQQVQQHRAALIVGLLAVGVLLATADSKN